ncbi:dynein regulatory complex subunit 2 [Bos indicus]|uniref:Dynein regulatory complex subunit 2 n=3 Tax=Bos TaxID=9903 RepID=DRC2_BOVIN|nr:dynein regulatory complex subunit 2 [Bos taurus]XP_019816232.1 PREDICTED: coiled-coil domain-containing protein 65 [Bos indicus]XP_027398526.1 dynein regulatory complex subunit 2 [Bos indicus x Bos taurus]Q2TA16.1 RecName: Full=Dynein regulatory complex subunit 2; AltName: Full=Coiled-coil domain-containing protein 65 [Bos taurus]AAI11169.1 Coiled-coil domain containing 65 [Bos taurus]DAA29922.1 TPA: coiled-coil domain-containing protein 65 [Bos taurus]
MSKKGKKAKVPLSDEEQLLLFQQKLLAEEEMAKKKERLLNQFLKDKLAKEEHNSALNLNKINTQWRTVLREIKTRELHKDIEILSQTFERVVDCKDSVIKSLAKDLSEAEEQHAHALRSHLHSIDQLLALQRCRLNLLEENYNMELEALTKEFETERKTIIDQHEKEIHYLQDVFMAMEQNYIDSEYESKLEFQSMWDDLKNKNLEEKHFLRLQLENIVEDLWRRFQDALKNYTDATEDRKIAFETLKVKDEKSSREIEAQMKKIQKLQDSIIIFKGKILVHSRESEEQNQDIREDKELVLVQLRKLKAQRTQARGIAQENLVKLTLESSATLKALREIVDKGEKILKLAEICRKFETEEEKVLPFYSSVLTPKEQEEIETMDLEEFNEELGKVIMDYKGMENFWKRYNKVKLEQLSLRHRRAQLLEINEKLREMLRQYLDGISVSDEVLSQLNPLFIVNHRSNLPQLLPMPTAQPGDKKPPATYNIIEAAHVVSHTL